MRTLVPPDAGERGLYKFSHAAQEIFPQGPSPENPGKSDRKTTTDFIGFIRKLTIHLEAFGWILLPAYDIFTEVAGDRWLENILARGKSEHRKATCLVKTRVPGAKSRVTESVTENKPPSWVRVKRRGKSPPDFRVSGIAGKTPCGARQSRGKSCPLVFLAQAERIPRVIVAPGI